MNLAGGSLKQPLPLDGVDIWNSLINDTPSPRNEIAYSGTTIRIGDWKYIDESAEYVSWKAGESQLYNIAQDQSEANNLVAQYPEKVKAFKARMKYWQQQARPTEEHDKIPNFPPLIYGEGEDAMLDKAFIAKLKTTWDASKKQGNKKKGAHKAKNKKAK